MMGSGCTVEPSGADGDGAAILWFRVVVVAALIASVAITWSLWNVRVSPTLLPAFDLPQISLGAPLIIAALATLMCPVPGAIVVSLLMGYGMLADQTRMQPEFFSLPILLWGSLPSPSARLIARSHLLALWFYAGTHKLINTVFVTDPDSPFAMSAVAPIPPYWLTMAVVSISVVEIGTAILAIVPRTRWLAAWSALLVHTGILAALVWSGEGRNIAVWPWNVALACSGFALIAPWSTSVATALRSTPLLARIATAAIALAPIGFYLGVVDAYPAHQLYSSGVARATIYCPAGCRPEQDVNATWQELNVPLPPEPRLYQASFVKTCAPGDVLRIEPPRALIGRESGDSTLQFCPAGSLPASHP